MTKGMTRVISVVAALGMSAAAVVLVGAPAHSVEDKGGIGKGRALVYVETPSATVTKVGKNSYRMILPPGSTGQWMGERTDSKGNTQTRVGDINAKKLSNKWTRFRYGDAAVPATLAWVASDGPSSALVRVSRPKVTDKGVRFDFTSKFTIPSTLTDVSINLQRAQGNPQARSTDTYNLNVTGDLWLGGNVTDDDEVNTRIYNASNNNTCWTGSGAKVIYFGDPTQYSVAANTCASVAYTNQLSSYGVDVTWPTERGGVQGALTYYLSVTPPNAAPFQFTQQLMSWSS